MSLFVIDNKKCNFCGLCVLQCPRNVIEMLEPNSPPSLADGGEERCISCGHCVSVCAPAAFSHRSMKPEELLSVQRRMIPNPDSVELLLRSRRSIRIYKKKKIPREILSRIINVARYAPSGSNSQMVQWLVIENSGEVKRLSGMVIEWMRAIMQAKPHRAKEWLFDILVDTWDRGIDPVSRGAPHLIVAHAPKDGPFAEGNSYIALTYLELAAHSLGLGTCWGGMFQAAISSHQPLADALELPEGNKSYGVMMLGYPKSAFHRMPLRNEPVITWR
jgi:nitroreductase/NAD-dependent dihydropyrimidine dehydrogenase PreA subunit